MQPDGDTLTKEDIETRPEHVYREPGDEERFTHYVDKKKYSIVDAIFNGTTVQAECGKIFHPVRDPKFPICPMCQEIVNYRSKD